MFGSSSPIFLLLWIVCSTWSAALFFLIGESNVDWTIAQSRKASTLHMHNVLFAVRFPVLRLRINRVSLSLCFANYRHPARMRGKPHMSPLPHRALPNQRSVNVSVDPPQPNAYCILLYTHNACCSLAWLHLHQVPSTKHARLDNESPISYAVLTSDQFGQRNGRQGSSTHTHIPTIHDVPCNSHNRESLYSPAPRS